MKDYFIWNGTPCTEYGIHVSEQPPLTIPEERTKQTAVPGRPGSLTTVEADDVYEDLVLSATCFLSDPSRIPEIAGWLRGSGTVSFADHPDGFYYARISNQIPFEKILRGNAQRSFVVNFRCFPFRYASDAAPITVLESGSFVENPGNVYAEPSVTVYGTGEITVIIGLTTIELTDIEDSIVLDSAVQEAYKDGTLLNGRMSGDFPVLLPGTNAVSWTGDVNRIVIDPHWRYLV